MDTADRAGVDPDPTRGEFVGTHLKTGLLAYLPRDGLGRCLVHIHPASWQPPAVLVCCLPDEEYPVLAERRAANA
jgi:hypothetical protein